MPDAIVRSPTLFSAASSPGEDVLRPVLLAARCACGHLFHPPQPYGCERCGKSGRDAERVELAARGVLTSAATVHVHPKLPTPFVLGRITLDAGPSIEAWLGTAPDALPLGARVEGVLVAGGKDDAGTPILDCRFVLEGSVP